MATTEEIAAKVARRAELRRSLAALEAELTQMGVSVIDSPHGTGWSVHKPEPEARAIESPTLRIEGAVFVSGNSDSTYRSDPAPEWTGNTYSGR